jgi:hypothetical protein
MLMQREHSAAREASRQWRSRVSIHRAFDARGGPGCAGRMEAPPRYNVLGVGVSALTLDRARELVLSVRGALRAVDKTEQEASAGRKSEPWKVAVAAHLKATTQAPNGWLTERLQMGTAVAVSHHVGQMRRAQNPEAARLLAKIAHTLNIKT